MSRSPFLTAVFHPLNLGILALAIAAGLCSAWWLAPAGFVLWLVMVVVIARDPGLKMTFTRQNRQPLAPRFQTRFDRLDKARFSVFNAFAQGTSPALQRTVEPMQTALDELVEHAYRLSLRMSALDNNFSVQRLTGNSESDIAKIQKSLQETGDVNARKEYENTLQSLQARQAQLKVVASLLSRFEAQLTGTASAIDSVVTSLASLQGRNAKQVADKIPPVRQIISEEENELKQFDSELEKTSLI